MIVSNEIGNRSGTLQSVNKTLFEMIGPQSDGMEEKKMRMLLRLNQATSHLPEEKEENKSLYLANEANLEEMSTADSGKEVIRKQIEGGSGISKFGMKMHSSNRENMGGKIKNNL